MYLIYVDESGSFRLADHHDFILTAVLVHESNWREFYQKINEVKSDLFHGSDPQAIEFHTTHIASRTEDFHGYSVKKAQQILSSMAEIISGIDCTLISVIISKEDIRKLDKPRNVMQRWVWMLMLERLETFLSKLNDNTNHGLICVDRSSSRIDNEIASIFHDFREQGSRYFDTEYLVEEIFFVDSALRDIIQVSDFVAWVSRQWYKIKVGKVSSYDEFNQNLFYSIKAKYHKDSEGNMIGAGVTIFQRKV